MHDKSLIFLTFLKTDLSIPHLWFINTHHAYWVLIQQHTSL